MNKKINRLLLGYLFVSVVFSIVIILRLLFTDFHDVTVFYTATGLANIVFYDLYYYIFPITYVMILTNFVEPASSDKGKSKRFSCFWFISYVLLLFFVWFDIIFSSVFLYLVPITVIISSTYFAIKNNSSLKAYFFNKKIISIFLVIFLLPNFSVILGFSTILNNTNQLETDAEKVNYISETVFNSHTSFWGGGGIYYTLHRAGNNFYKFLIVGAGACSEMGYSSIAFLDSLGYETRTVSFPGEQHMFAEVKLDGEWFVIDPGYANMTMISQIERGNARIKEMGGLSYAVANIDTNPLIITNSYTTTDEFLLKIVKDNVPQPEVEVVLKHTFRNMTEPLPKLTTDSNGEALIELGIMNYNKTDNEYAEKFYWVFVDGKNTTNTLQSSGSGKSHQIVIDVE